MSPPQNPPLLIKICGVTTPADAALAAHAGAGAIGVNLWPGSKRYVGDHAAARAVLAAVPAGVLKVGVFVNAAPDDVGRAVDQLGLDRAQLHGDETATAFAGFDPAGLIRAVRVRDAASFAEALQWNTRAAVRLYDAFVDGFGGGGQPAPWGLIAGQGRRPFWLAGGLTPDNVAAAITATAADGVDVASGVESAPGRKDPARVAAFVAAARAAAAALGYSLSP
ncbi:MAG TPA: phosphoribosylanthranilate isomerase [Polyangia bacterium]|jgi:phosphoribosylanthranilate isomerase|nr:phosphoribosylanthranilate isomerase [Polyangia bacterium]